MAKCDEGYRCDVCGRDVEAITDSELYLRYVLGEVPLEQLHALKAFGLVGSVENKEADFAAERKDAPTIYLFVQTEHFGRPMARFIKTLDGEIGKADDKAAAIAIWVGEKESFEKNKEYL